MRWSQRTEPSTSRRRKGDVEGRRRGILNRPAVCAKRRRGFRGDSLSSNEMCVVPPPPSLCWCWSLFLFKSLEADRLPLFALHLYLHLGRLNALLTVEGEPAPIACSQLALPPCVPGHSGIHPNVGARRTSIAVGIASPPTPAARTSRRPQSARTPAPPTTRRRGPPYTVCSITLT